MTYLKALELSEQMWEWLCDNPHKDKNCWEYYEKYFKNDLNDCLICQYRENICNGAQRCSGVEGYNLDKCFLSKICVHFSQKWTKRRTIATRRKFAEKVYFSILNERLKNM